MVFVTFSLLSPASGSLIERSLPVPDHSGYPPDDGFTQPQEEINLPRIMPAVRKAAGILATLIGAWLILAAILLSFAVIGSARATPAPVAAHRPVHIQRQRAPTSGAYCSVGSPIRTRNLG
jgi:hypothetical protein